MTSAPRILRDVPLAARNTFGVAATAPLLAEVADAAALPGLFAGSDFRGSRPLVIGGGSNLLFVGNPDCPLIALTAQSVTVLDERSDTGDCLVIVRADAGVAWHPFVMRTLALGLSGLENLALIPGTVGAAPIQNIGAYGVEVCEFVHGVEVFEPSTGTTLRLDRAACAFAYRDSLFKQQPDRYIVTAVEFALSRAPAPRLDYAGLRDELVTMGLREPTPADIARAVVAIRQRKLPDPAVLGNAGSFFKNPIVPVAQAEALLSLHPALPVFRAGSDTQRKLSAAWLIEGCGWKGHRDGDAGIAAAHALVLVNHGGASGQQLFDLARRISESVQLRHGVALEPEPRMIGARW